MNTRLQNFRSFTLEKIRQRNTRLEREALTVYGYHYQDSTAPLYFTYLAVFRVILTHPVALLCGFENFIKELVAIIVEVLARATTTDGIWHRVKETVLPATIEKLLEAFSQILEYNKKAHTMCEVL